MSSLARVDLIDYDKSMTTTSETADNFRECDTTETLAQIGRMNVLTISGGRVLARKTGVTLPVGHGYSVTVDLAADDTYTVRRVFTRSGVARTKGEVTGVYYDQVGEMAYRASCYVNVDFGAHRP